MLLQLQVQPNLFLSCLVPWGGMCGAGMSFARLIDIPAAHDGEAQLQTPSFLGPTMKPPQECTLCLPLGCGPCWVPVHGCPKAIILPSAGNKKQTYFLGSSGDQRSCCGSAVSGACADRALCPACYCVWQKKLQKLREKPKR